MSLTLIKNALIVNEGKTRKGHVLIDGEKIAYISYGSEAPTGDFDREIEAEGLHLIPGLIDDQVHFREPGLTHKGEIYTEAKAAVAGGVTTYMEMPNTVPNALTQALLEDKYKRAGEVSLANYSFFMGVSNDNLEEVLKTDPRNVCGLKIFMGSSTGNMLVDNETVLEEVFAKANMLIATHCEDEATVRADTAAYKEKYGDAANATMHGNIRSREACYKSSSFAVQLAKKHNTRLHILHISTKEEVALFEKKPLAEKRITAEACTHHLWFSDEDYATKGNNIKWNPAVKTAEDRAAIRQGLIDGNIDVLATDHAPHTKEEKAQHYWQAPSGGPLVQHTLSALCELVHQKVFTLEMVVQKSAHNVAELFQIENRGYIRQGYFADLVLIDMNSPWKVQTNNILYKCGWSPFDGQTFKTRVTHTFVNGHLVMENDGPQYRPTFDESKKGKRLTFNR